MSRDMKDVHKITKAAVICKLAAAPGKIHVVADGWTSPNVISFIGVVVQFVDEGRIHTLTLDYVKYVYLCFLASSLSS